jgi:hypothetical protein
MGGAMMKWKVDVKGKRCGKWWEISVVRIGNDHGFRSYGWFGAEKLLVSHNGGPCEWPIVGFVWDAQIKIAEELCLRLNNGEQVDS